MCSWQHICIVQARVCPTRTTAIRQQHPPPSDTLTLFGEKDMQMCMFPDFKNEIDLLTAVRRECLKALRVWKPDMLIRCKQFIEDAELQSKL